MSRQVKGFRHHPRERSIDDGTLTATVMAVETVTERASTVLIRGVKVMLARMSGRHLIPLR
jgi:hypothetical protein